MQSFAAFFLLQLSLTGFGGGVLAVSFALVQGVQLPHGALAGQWLVVTEAVLGVRVRLKQPASQVCLWSFPGK